MSDPRQTHLRFLLDAEYRYLGEPMAKVIDDVLLLLPDLVEDRDALAQDVNAGLSEEHREAQKRLEKKRREFSSVLCQVEHLRQVIRQYYRNTSI